MNIETVCAHPERFVSEGTARDMVDKAKERAREKTGGRVTLTDVSKGTGTRLYQETGFTPTDPGASGDGTKMQFLPEILPDAGTPSSSDVSVSASAATKN